MNDLQTCPRCGEDKPAGISLCHNCINLGMPQPDSTLDISTYALAKQIPNMTSGFYVSTDYGMFYIATFEAAPFIEAAEKTMKTRIEVIKKHGDLK